MTEDEEKILNLTKDIFINTSATELSLLTHEHKCWKDYYKKSQSETYNYYYKDQSIIPVEKIVDDYQEDLDLVRNILSAYEENDEIDEDSISLNGITFYYNPKEIKMNDLIKEKLLKFPGNYVAYTLYIDEKQGLVIY